MFRIVFALFLITMAGETAWAGCNPCVCGFGDGSSDLPIPDCGYTQETGGENLPYLDSAEKINAALKSPQVIGLFNGKAIDSIEVRGASILLGMGSCKVIATMGIQAEAGIEDGRYVAITARLECETRHLPKGLGLDEVGRLDPACVVLDANDAPPGRPRFR